MKILSASEDFEQLSLSRFAEVMEKLRYLAGLRGPQGEYAHWGLSKVYGHKTAIEAIAQAHSRAFAEHLSSPLEKLARETASAAIREGLSAEDYVEKFQASRERMLPQLTKGGSPKHWDAVVLALKKIARSGRLEVHRSA